MNYKIKIEPFLMKRGNQVARAAIEMMADGLLEGWQLQGFTICDDERGIFVLFPAVSPQKKEGQAKGKTYFFLRHADRAKIDELENAILDAYDSVIDEQFRNRPRVKLTEKV